MCEAGWPLRDQLRMGLERTLATERDALTQVPVAHFDPYGPRVHGRVPFASLEAALVTLTAPRPVA
jgi:hypothetical protein